MALTAMDKSGVGKGIPNHFFDSKLGATTCIGLGAKRTAPTSGLKDERSGSKYFQNGLWFSRASADLC